MRVKDVLLLMDSVTRFAMAQREVGLSWASRGIQGLHPERIATLPKLLERAAWRQTGQYYRHLCSFVEGDDLEDPVADAYAILDGHIVLTRKLAERIISGD